MSDKPCQTIGELREQIITGLKEQGLTEEQLNKKRLGRKVLTYLTRRRLLVNATSEIINEAIMSVLASPQEQASQQ
ncbi:hypothetical protein J7J83_02475 [bacterium]|nr:hypothetical protein [bacterium]